MEFISTQKYILTSPKKLREVVALIKKLSPSEALEQLSFFKKRAAKPLQKVIKTAIANARQKNVDAENLKFKEIQIGEGPRLKRYRAGARGRVKPYKRRMSHIRVILEVKEKEEKGLLAETKVKEKDVVSKNSNSKAKKIKKGFRKKDK